MSGDYLVIEEFRRLLAAFAAEVVPGFIPERPGCEDRYDPLQPRPVSSITGSVNALLGLRSEIPIEWRVAAYLSQNTRDLLSIRALSSLNIELAVETLHQHQEMLTNCRTITHKSGAGGRLGAIHYGADVSSPSARFVFQTLTAAKLHRLFHHYSGSERQHQVDTHAACLGELMDRFNRELDFIDIDFRASEIAYGLSRDLLKQELSPPDDQLRHSLDVELRRRAAEMPAPGSLKERIKYHIRRNQLSTASIDEICDTFRMQRRTLARLLRNEGTTFTAILTELRHERALHLVRDTALPLKRVASELGFNSDASFNMAFKSWTGMTPMRYRNGAAKQLPANDLLPTVFACVVPTRKPLVATYKVN